MSPANFSKHILLIYTTMFCIHSENDMFCSTYLRCSMLYWITFGLFFSFIFLLFLNRDVRDTWLYAERVSRINNVLNTTAFLVVFRCFWSFFFSIFSLVTVFESSFVFRSRRRMGTISFSIPPRKWSEYVSTLERKKSWRTRNFNKTTVFNESCKLNKSQANVLKFFPYRIRQRNVTQRNTTQRKDNSASASAEIQESNSK